MWPETVWLLNDNCDISTDGTRTIEEWVAYCLPDLDARKEYYTMRNRLGKWETNNSELLCELLDVINIGMQWNYLVRCRYNLTFALLGYTEGQSSKILNCLPHIENDVFFQNYHPVVYPSRYGSYYTGKNLHAKRLVPPPGKRKGRVSR